MTQSEVLDLVSVDVEVRRRLLRRCFRIEVEERFTSSSASDSIAASALSLISCWRTGSNAKALNCLTMSCSRAPINTESRLIGCSSCSGACPSSPGWAWLETRAPNLFLMRAHRFNVCFVLAANNTRSMKIPRRPKTSLRDKVNGITAPHGNDISNLRVCRVIAGVMILLAPFVRPVEHFCFLRGFRFTQVLNTNEFFIEALRRDRSREDPKRMFRIIYSFGTLSSTWLRN